MDPMPEKEEPPMSDDLGGMDMSDDDKLWALLAVSYTHLRAHETPEHFVCRLLLEKKNFSKNPQID